ncbi:MAG: DUF2812 domain-containing protein [Lachnospiraceae bacterium]|nr:DUF2812 domain-containing protein [Lachnospiraceae bacterium]
MVKFKLYFDKDKETKWLNEMANKGWAMTGFFAGFYTFEPCEQGEYTYQIDFGNRFFSVTDDYRDFMADAGIEIVQTWGFWVILRKRTAKGDFELYTDVESQIEHYRKIQIMFKVVTVIELICFFTELFAAVQSQSHIFYGCAFFILAFVVAFMSITFRTGDIIHELKERQTGIEEPRNRNISVFLPIGLLCNSVALLIQDSVSEYIKLPIQVIAIIFMLIGIYKTAQKRKNNL